MPMNSPGEQVKGMTGSRETLREKFRDSVDASDAHLQALRGHVTALSTARKNDFAAAIPCTIVAAATIPRHNSSYMKEDTL